MLTFCFTKSCYLWKAKYIARVLLTLVPNATSEVYPQLSRYPNVWSDAEHFNQKEVYACICPLPPCDITEVMSEIADVCY